MTSDSFYTLDVPWHNVASVVLWEGTIGCTVNDIVNSSVEAKNVEWKKGGQSLREGVTNNGFQALTFDEIERNDGGLSVVTFDASSHETAPLRPFEFNLTVEVNCECIL